jgi:Protein of unknown function (DUF2652)
MTSMISRGTRTRGTLLLADISGYTSFLSGVGEAHDKLRIDTPEAPPAYDLVSGLLDRIVSALVPPFRLVKFEGDAVFAIADEPAPAIRGQGLPDLLRACHAAFERGLAEGDAGSTCECGYCTTGPELGLKFVIHHGDFVTNQIFGQQEVAGPDVIVAHRLLKNHARDLVGTRPYALLSDVALAALDVSSGDMAATTETYDDLPPVAVHVLALG